MFSKIIIFLVKIYQKMDGLKHAVLYSTFGFTSYCKHKPSCSQYLVNQIKEHGTIVGLNRGFRRLLTCHS